MLLVICDGGFSKCAEPTQLVQVHDLIDMFRNALGFLPSPWNLSADCCASMRKSRILIVSFFNYIQVISHGKVGGKVAKGRTPPFSHSTSNQVSFSKCSWQFQTTIQVNDTQLNTSANQFQQSEFQDTCHLAWYTRILACLRPASPSASLYHGHLYHPLSLLTIAITIPCPSIWTVPRPLVMKEPKGWSRETLKCQQTTFSLV